MVWTILLGKTPARALELFLIVQWFNYSIVERTKPMLGLKEKKKSTDLGRESCDGDV